MIKDLEKTIQQLWGQVGDEDSYIAVQEKRIDELVQKCDSLRIN